MGLHIVVDFVENRVGLQMAFRRGKALARLTLTPVQFTRANSGDELRLDCLKVALRQPPILVERWLDPIKSADCGVDASPRPVLVGAGDHGALPHSPTRTVPAQSRVTRLGRSPEKQSPQDLEILGLFGC